MTEVMAEHRRLAILRHLHEVGGFTSNISVLLDVCNGLGISSSRAQVASEIGWLAELGLVTRQDAGEFIVARLTERGADVAAGRAFVEGIKRPRAGA